MWLWTLLACTGPTDKDTVQGTETPTVSDTPDQTDPTDPTDGPTEDDDPCFAEPDWDRSPVEGLTELLWEGGTASAPAGDFEAWVNDDLGLHGLHFVDGGALRAWSVGDVLTVVPWGAGSLVHTSEGLYLWDGIWRTETDLTALMPQIDHVQPDGEDLWFETSTGLKRLSSGTLVDIRFGENPPTGPVAPGGVRDGTPVLWVVDGKEMHAMTADTVIATERFDRPVKQVATDISGDTWVLINNKVYRQEFGECWREVDDNVSTLVSVPTARGVWWRSDEGWTWAFDEAMHPITEGPTTDDVRADEYGRLWWTDEEGAKRTSANRPLIIAGLDPFDLVARAETLTVLPTAPQAVVDITASATPESGTALDLTVTDGIVSFDLSGEDLPKGLWTIDVQATYNDGEQALASLPVSNGLAIQPTWTADVQLVYEARCQVCHASNTETILDGPDQWILHYEDIVDNVSTGKMPPGDVALDPIEVLTIKEWGAGGFPQ